MKAGGIFGASALGMDPPFPDVYSCNEDAQCQSGWCNTAVPTGGGKGQCQTKGKVVAGIGGKGQPGAHCSSDDECAFGVACNPEKKMCESMSDPGNVCYIAHQIGQQDADAGASRKTPTSEIAAQAKVPVTSDVTGKAEGCYKAGYSARSTALVSPAKVVAYDAVSRLAEIWDMIVGKYRPLTPTNADVDEFGTPMVYRRVKQSEVTPALQAMAKRIIQKFHGQPFGTNIPFSLSGKSYAVKIEQHYHEPGGPLKPWGYHKGSSTFILAPKAVSGFGTIPTPVPGAGAFRNVTTAMEKAPNWVLGVGAVTLLGIGVLATRKTTKQNKRRAKRVRRRKR